MLSQLGQYVDKDNDDDNSKEKSKSSSSHSNAASKDEKTESFDQYIKSLDMDYRPYINNNKDTESDVVTHKNSVEDDTPTAAASTNDEYFTNEDHRTHVDAHLNEELGQLTSDNGNEHADSPFFQGSGGAQTVNTDSSTTDDGEWATDEMPAPVNQWVDESSKEKGHENQGVWNEEMSELNGEHADSPFFQGSGGAQTVNQGSSTTADDGDWIVDEMPAPVNQWVDESSDVKDHSNEGAWIEEEVDPSTFAAAHANQDGEGWSEVTSDNNYASSDFDHSNVGTWIAQEIDDAPEPTTTTTPHVDDSSPQGWVAEEDAHSNESTDIPDHSNIGQWQAEEIDSDNDHLSSQYSHGNDKVADENDWVESESTHPDVAASGWQEDTSAHPDATGGWQEDTSAHPDANGWQEVSSTTHPNVAADGWQEESSITTHPDVAADGWQEEESASPAPHMDDNVLMYSAEELIN
ncbi:hypothetical protein BDB00DRAFT_560627 [Zychaea mexicana]|uniref:uncharacterized protein n=1 Tax=Zychaea mexicana TaxID=64656 RepID=UPI0022FEA64F|nr:uncharacterized protein BDB00DRAFT_560627 [Zychaea mexicana]KAI9490280.1 hypothetical protein BDB00DRAFT_560627 [Zychaea mexicana]